MHDKWWPFWSFHAHFGQIGAICNVCIRSKVFFKYLDKLIGIREGHSYETSFSRVIKRKNFKTSSSTWLLMIWTTWQQEEDQYQILNSNDMTAGAKLTVKNVYLHLSYQQSTYNYLSKRIPDTSILFWIKPKFEWLYASLIIYVFCTNREYGIVFVFICRSGKTISGSQLVHKT